MFCSVLSAALYGVDAVPIYVEADVSDGMPSFTMVGCVSTQVKEAQDRVVAAMAADELLNIAGVKASIVLAPDGRGNCFASARSIGEVNVQLIMEMLGGGGNRNAAAMQMPNTAPEDALKKVYSAIDDYLQ